MGGWGGREGIVEGVRGAREGVERGDQQHPAALCCPPLQQPQLLSSSHRSNSGSTKNTKKRTNTKCYFAAESSRQVKDKYTRPLSVLFLILTEKQVLKDTRRVKDKYTA